MDTRLGAILVQQGWITQDQLNVLLRDQKDCKWLLGSFAVKRGLITGHQLTQALRFQQRRMK